MSRRFHVVPEFLQTPDFLKGRAINSIDFRVEGSIPGFIEPISKTKITKAYHNKDYFVAGCKESRCGWVVNVPDGVSDFELRFFWTFSLGSMEDKEVLIHKINVTLADDGDGFYSMCAMTWPDLPVAPVFGQLRGVGTLKGVSEYRRGNNFVNYKPIMDEFCNPGGMYLEENVVIPLAHIDESIGEEWFVMPRRAVNAS